MVQLCALPEELRTALGIYDDGNGRIKQEILVKALEDFSQMCQNKFPVSVFHKSLKLQLDKLDKDKDGYLTIQEIGEVGRKFTKQRNRYREFFVSGLVIFLFTTLALGSDVAASKGQLVDREDGTVLKASTSSYIIEDNVLKSGAVMDGDVNYWQTVSTSIMEYIFDRLTGDWPNQALSAISKITVSQKLSFEAAGVDDHVPFLHAHVDFTVRLPNSEENSGDSLVLMQTPAGRFVVDGRGSVQPAVGELATMDGATLHRKAVPISGRRQAQQQCQLINKCKSGGGLNMEVQFPMCPRGMFCIEPGFSTPCSDLVLMGSSKNHNGCEGLYTLQFDDDLGGPSFKGPKCAIVALGAEWQLMNLSDYNLLATQNPNILGTAYLNPVNFTANGSITYTSSLLFSAQQGIFCPGNDDQKTSGLWYAPPFFANCELGFYCFHFEFQFPCNNLVLSAKSNYSSAYAGTYFLDTRTFNGHPIYLSYKFQSCSLVCSEFFCHNVCSLVDKTCTKQGCNNSPVYAGLIYSAVYSPSEQRGGVYSIIRAAFLQKVLAKKIPASSFAVATRTPPSWQETRDPTQDWTEFDGAWTTRTLTDVICPAGSKLPTTGVYSS